MNNAVMPRNDVGRERWQPAEHRSAALHVAKPLTRRAREHEGVLRGRTSRSARRCRICSKPASCSSFSLACCPDFLLPLAPAVPCARCWGDWDDISSMHEHHQPVPDSHCIMPCNVPHHCSISANTKHPEILQCTAAQSPVPLRPYATSSTAPLADSDKKQHWSQNNPALMIERAWVPNTRPLCRLHH